MMRKRRVASLLLCCAMAASAFVGCSKEAGSTGSQNGSQGAKDSLTVATTSETPTMSPYEHNTVAGSYMNMLTFSTLFVTDENLQPVPSLVESYETTSDTEWVFHLKQGVKFHDGSDLTAEDVKASLDYAKTFAEVSQYGMAIQAVEVVDDRTVKVTTPNPSATLLYDLCNHGNAIVPKELIDSGNDFNSNPVGSGPYEFVEWNRGDSVVFRAFDDYFEGKAPIENLTWKIIPEGSSRTIALEAGEVDMVIEVEAMDADRIAENPDLTLLKKDSVNIQWLMLNNEKPGLDNANVRHAINSAINREDLVTVALNGMGTPAYSATPMGMLGSTEEGADTYDVEKAKAYMEESGVDPASVELSIICSNDTKKRAAEVIQANLKEIGIQAKVESMDLATYISECTAGNYTGTIGGYSTTDMVTYLAGVFHSDTINASNMARLNDPEIDAMIEQASSTIDDAKREEILKQTTIKLNAICPVAPLYQDTYLRAYSADLEGVSLNAAGNIHFEDISWKES